MKQIATSLQELSKEKLINLVSAVYGIDLDIDDIVERHIDAGLASDGDNNELYASLSRQINALELADDYIDWRASEHFSSTLDALLDDINTLVRPLYPNQALELVENFLDITDNTVERCDDSNGDVSEVFREAVDLWLDIAKVIRSEHPEKPRDWLASILHYFDNNDYGCFDDIISHSAGLLNDEELQQLALRFENQLTQALAKQQNASTKYNADASHASIGLQAVAEALQDMSLFEKATLLCSPQPNPLQMAAMIKYALSIEDLVRAQHWLDQAGWAEHKALYKDLTTQLLRLQGNVAQIKKNFQCYFEDEPNYHNLADYWALATEQERIGLQSTIADKAPLSVNLNDAINMLFLVDNTQLAADTLLARTQELTSQFYTTLTTWVATFEQHQHNLAAILCYRTLLINILEPGRSKAYHHAADYFHALLKLDKTQADYQGFANAQAFIRYVQKQHGRKRSFWQQADYPNKDLA
jgi:hypothetical protein